MAALSPPSLSVVGATSSLGADEVAKLRVPPHSIEAEQSVLGGLLLDNSAWDRASDLLTDSDFYRHEHQLIFMAIQQLINASKPADVITVFEQLQMSGKGSDVGGLAYLNALAQSVPSAANMRRYAEIVRERAVLRKLVTVSDEIATNAFNPNGKAVADILDEAEAKIMKIGEEGNKGKQGFHAMDSLVVDLLDRVQELADNGSDDVTGVRTGFIDMDKMTAGLQKGDLIILAARPSMGKTAFALNIGENVAVNEGLPVAVFSMEMGASQLALRMVGSIGRINQQNLRTGRLSDDEWSRLSETVEKLRTANVFIDETPGLSPNELRARARRLARQFGGTLGLIIVDYLQLMSGSGGNEDGYYFILGRTDDVINVAGHRLGTREIEEAVSSHPAVAEVAVVGVADEVKGQVARAFVVPRDASRVADEPGRRALEAEIMQTVDRQLGAVARPARVYFVNVLPKTRSGKLLRRAIQAVCEGRDTGDLTTIEDPSALQQLQDAVKR